MQNELLMIASIFVFFGGLVAFFRFFGKQGIFAWTVIATIAANIEVLILVHAFGLDTTLGNVIFASSFLICRFCASRSSCWCAPSCLWSYNRERACPRE